MSEIATDSTTSASPVRCVLGVDGGGTKTACVLVTMAGETIGEGQGAASNYHAVGADAARASVRSAIDRAIQSARSHRGEAETLTIAGIGLGLAGIGSPADIEVVRTWVSDYIAGRVGGCNWDLQADDRAGVYIDHDCAIALAGGTAGEIADVATGGIAAIAGTGSIVFGRNGAGKTVRVGGWGYLLGDEGSGYDLARRALQAALRSADGRCEPTQLLPALLQHFQVKTPRELAIFVYRQNVPVRELASLAALVDRVAATGDAVARQVIERGADELALAIGACARQLFSTTDAIEVATIGGVWQSEAGFRARVSQGLRAEFPDATLIWPRSSPARGAALTVLKSLEADSDSTLRSPQRLVQD